MLKALIFDMDGTLVHSDPVHLRAFGEVLEPYGVTVDEDLYQRSILGQTNERIFASLLPNEAVTRHEELADVKEATFRRLARNLRPLTGLVDLLDWAKERELAVALVTNAPKLNADHMLDAIGLADRFTVRITIEDVARGKPDPLPYLTALEQLNVNPDEAIVFEDSPSGMKAAKAAGIFGIGVLTGLTEADMVSFGADMTIADFSDKGLWGKLKSGS
jgi:beta-phosphoglucomutase